MVGQSLGRYVLESKLGEGGMGIVYKARDSQLGRTVAIKVLPSHQVADPARRRRFMQEARAAGALNHPNITAIFDMGSDDGTDFLVMEYVSGRTLERLLPSGGFSLRQALTYGVAIADALSVAHQAGIVHRDLKPANVMITDGGALKILDFGVAKLHEPEADSGQTRTVSITQVGMTVGTPAYMSPEQAEARPVDGRSDIFSFGAVLYEMVTGRRAFDGDSRMSIMAKILREEPQPPSQLASDLPADVEKIILRCLRKDPARRYQSMADLKLALEDVALEPTTPSSRKDTPPSLPVAPAPRRGWFAAAAALAAVVIAASGYALLQSRRASSDTAPLRAVPLTSLSGVIRSPSLGPLANTVVFAWTGPTQDNPDIYVQQVGAGSPLRLTTDPGNDYSPSWSPDGRAIAFLRRGSDPDRSELRLVPPLGGPERKVADIRHEAALFRAISMSWCPDASCLLVTDTQDDPDKPEAIFAIVLDTGQRRQLTFPPANTLDLDPVVAPDGSALVFRRDTTPFTGEFYRLPLKAGVVPDGDPVRLTTALNTGKATWTADSREILFSNRGALWRLDAVRGGTPSRLPFVGQDGLTPTVSREADGRQRLVYVRSFMDGNVWRVDTPAPGAPAVSPPRSAIASTRSDYTPNVSPDGQRVVFMSSRSGEAEVWIARLDGTNAVQLTSLSAVPGFPRWSPDGALIAFHGDPAGRPDVITVPANGGRSTIVTEGNLPGAFPSFSRDGRFVYLSSDRGGAWRLWKMPVSGGEAVAISPHEAALGIESYDGRDVYYIEAADRTSAVWRLPVSGGTPEKVLDGVVLTNFDVVEKGIYYIEREASSAGEFFVDRPGGVFRLQFYDFASKRSTTVASNLGPVGAGMTATRDGRTILFSRVDSAVDELMVVDNFQ